MATSEQVEQLKHSVEEWNQWRRLHSEILPDLSNANLSRADLREANLSRANLFKSDLREAYLNNADLREADLSKVYFIGANLKGADLSNADLSSAHLIGAYLRGANLSGANLSGADFREADLSGANLSRAYSSSYEVESVTGPLIGSGPLIGRVNPNRVNLSGADLSGADLSGADLSGADLRGTDFSETNLSETNLSDATIESTLFGNLDLRVVKGLETVRHDGPSYISISTFERSQGNIPEVFLRGAGLSDTFIEYLPSLLTTAIQYASCFISYAHQDEALAQRLYRDLQNKGVRCWFAPHDLRPGDYHHSRIDEAIHIHEKVLLLLSEHAVMSSWVKHEVQIALAREIKQDCIILFPLRLDEVILRAKDDWAARLRESRHIGEFSGWQDDAIYQQRFTELLRHLKIKTT